MTRVKDNIFILILLLLTSIITISIFWKSFFASGSSALYVILYSIYYYFKLKIKRLSTTIIFFGMITGLFPAQASAGRLSQAPRRSAGHMNKRWRFRRLPHTSGFLFLMHRRDHAR